MTTEEKYKEQRHVSRRELLKTGVGLIGAGLAIGEPSAFALESPGVPAATSQSVIGMKFEPKDTVRLGVIGVGSRGTGMLSNFLAIPHVQVNAICDSVMDHATHAREMVEKSSGKQPEIYTNGEHDYERLCKRGDLDFIYIATPWDWHAPMAIAAMKGGTHVGVEVPAVNTVEECQQIVDTSEKTRRHCMIMENCCYGHSETDWS